MFVEFRRHLIEQYLDIVASSVTRESVPQSIHVIPEATHIQDQVPIIVFRKTFRTADQMLLSAAPFSTTHMPSL